MNGNYAQVKLYQEALLEFIDSGQCSPHDKVRLLIELQTVDAWLKLNRASHFHKATLEIPSEFKMIER